MSQGVEPDLQKLRDEAAVHISQDSPAVIQVGLWHSVTKDRPGSLASLPVSSVTP